LVERVVAVLVVVEGNQVVVEGIQVVVEGIQGCSLVEVHYR